VSLLGPVRPLRDGGYRFRLDAEERAILGRLAEDLRELILADDPGVARLFPAAYRDDPEAAAEYDRLVRGDLTIGRLDALDTVEETLNAERLDHEQANAWCGALNDLRLVLGERLGVTEDLDLRRIRRDDPQAWDYAVYGWLTYLQGSFVDALASRL
jgi:hypothetical protein